MAHPSVAYHHQRHSLVLECTRYTIGDHQYCINQKNHLWRSVRDILSMLAKPPPGWRTARAENTQARSLSQRLREHARSITQAKSLRLSDFSCRFIILENIEGDLVAPIEAALIRMYKPPWNSVIDGFGNHDPGSGRHPQAKSEWDVLHPGRPWADRLTGTPPNVRNVKRKIAKYFESQ